VPLISRNDPVPRAEYTLLAFPGLLELRSGKRRPMFVLLSMPGWRRTLRAHVLLLDVAEVRPVAQEPKGMPTGNYRGANLKE
jgi:hypothetical protein